MAKAHKNADFVLGDGCREPSSANRSSALPATNPAGCIWQPYARQQIAATYHATCRRACCRNLLLRPTCRAYDRAYPRTTYLPLILPCIPPWRYPRATYPRACCRGILPCSGSRAQRAGDSDVGANDKGAGDDPGDWVDAH